MTARRAKSASPSPPPPPFTLLAESRVWVDVLTCPADEEIGVTTSDCDLEGGW